MKLFSILFTILFSTTPLIFQETSNLEKDTIKVYVFLHESCRISQYYTPTLKTLSQEYGSEKVLFEGIFPNQKTDEADLLAFQQKYDLSFPMVIDQNQTLTKKLGATVTPEVIVYKEKEDKILYKGRIDNSYFRVGKRRQVTTTSELREVLEAIQQEQPVKVAFQEAIGCFIRRI